MEEDETTPKSLPPWVELEYAHMIMLAGINGRVEFTHLSHNSGLSLDARLSSINEPAASHEVHTKSVLELLEQKYISITRVCLLDPKAQTALAPEDGNIFDLFLVWGEISIPGDDPPRDRTSELRQLGFPTRHLGPTQMTTDTALGVTKRVVDDKVQLNAIPYIVRHTEIRGHNEHSLSCFRTFQLSHSMLKKALKCLFGILSTARNPFYPPGCGNFCTKILTKVLTSKIITQTLPLCMS
ncbi:uncharacterized protein EDB91DRAFT_1132993 [Suillus paluster]|uniref:uncharacterized protein n=1 Tax=Suillus paluster TaxID=48578 RepID=UPI001B870FFF|nr:uncharacterized protein EDB91DRAFT_1132993 [Suillus paluster]KAG1740530.1 hypothetical protein EDB91DRAFT_1132993 [Suillus paluster]